MSPLMASARPDTCRATSSTTVIEFADARVDNRVITPRVRSMKRRCAPGNSCAVFQHYAALTTGCSSDINAPQHPLMSGTGSALGAMKGKYNEERGWEMLARVSNVS